MKTNFLIVPFLFLLSVTTLQAQLPPACMGGSQPAVSCETACILCNFAGYTGSTAGYPSGIVPNFCGTVENAQWLGFIAGAGSATFTIIPFNCSDGNGVQVALYDDCMGVPLACDKGEADGDNIPVSIAINMTPGDNYYLMIDGYAGDQCEFTISVSPPEAVFEPPLGVVQEVSGPPKACPGATLTYTVQPVSGAGAYIWDGPPGTLVDSMPVPFAAGQSAKITLGNTSGNICVQAANSCSINPPCSASMFVEILSDSDRPQIVADTSLHLNCLETPVTLQPEIAPPGSYLYAWAADSTGTVLSGGNSDRPEVSTTGSYTLTVTDFANGCSSTAVFTVGPPEMPVAGIMDVRNLRCYNDGSGGVRLGGFTAGVAPYLFSLDGGPLLQTPEFQFLDAGDHTLHVQDAFGCEWDTAFVLTQPEEMIVSLGQDTVIHLGQTLPLFENWQVNYPDRVAQTLVMPPELAAWVCDTCRYCPTNTFRYRITVVDSAGCRASGERQVTVSKERLVFIPNVFKPDSPSSGGNELFRIFCGEDVLRIDLLQLYNRWGQKVYERTDFDPADESVGWDGRLGGEKLPPGVLLCYASVVFKDGQKETYRKDVTLLR